MERPNRSTLSIPVSAIASASRYSSLLARRRNFEQASEENLKEKQEVGNTSSIALSHTRTSGAAGDLLLAHSNLAGPPQSGLGNEPACENSSEQSGVHAKEHRHDIT